jgi:hypothetical protein
MKKGLGIFVVSTLLLSGAVLVAPAHADCPTDVGAEIAAACPCSARNHGQYVKCVVQFRNGLRRAGCLTAETQKTIARCAARSTCGKPDAVLCCFVSGTGTCNDPLPGDGTVAGTCSNDATIACDTDAACTVLTGPKIKHDAGACLAHGGYISGTGSVCAGCATAVACCLPTGCQVLSDTDCMTQGGTSTPGSAPSCNPNPCVVP